MIDKKLIPYGGLKKEPFSGTHHGMRYFFRGDDGKSSTTFTVFIYPEPWCFEDTPEEEKEKCQEIGRMFEVLAKKREGRA